MAAEGGLTLKVARLVNFIVLTPSQSTCMHNNITPFFGLFILFEHLNTKAKQTKLFERVVFWIFATTDIYL